MNCQNYLHLQGEQKFLNERLAALPESAWITRQSIKSRLCVIEQRLLQQAQISEHNSMITTVTQKNRVTIPIDVARMLGIKPGYKLDWLPVKGKDEIIVRVIPDRAEMARRLMGMGAHLAPERDVITELDEERECEDIERLRSTLPRIE